DADAGQVVLREANPRRGVVAREEAQRLRADGRQDVALDGDVADAGDAGGVESGQVKLGRVVPDNQAEVILVTTWRTVGGTGGQLRIGRRQGAGEPFVDVLERAPHRADSRRGGWRRGRDGVIHARHGGLDAALDARFLDLEHERAIAAVGAHGADVPGGDV